MLLFFSLKSVYTPTPWLSARIEIICAILGYDLKKTHHKQNPYNKAMMISSGAGGKGS